MKEIRRKIKIAIGEISQEIGLSARYFKDIMKNRIIT